MREAARASAVRPLRRALLAACLGAAGVLGAASAWGASPVSPDAVKRIHEMGDLLKNAKSFSFTCGITREEPSDIGQLINVSGTDKVAMQRPALLRVEATGDTGRSDYYYDGKTFTVYDPEQKVYGQVAAPATTDALLEQLSGVWGRPLPEGEVLVQDPGAFMTEGLTSAYEVGVVSVDGTPCLQLALSEPEADWQIWIEEGQRPVPRRAAIIYKKAPGAPRVLLSFSDWSFEPPAKDRFVFVPPPGAVKAQVAAPEAAKKGGSK